MSGVCFRIGGCVSGCMSNCPFAPEEKEEGTMEEQKVWLSKRISDMEHERTLKDHVQHPAHYTQGIECWDYVVSQKLGFLEGNVIKYVTRYRMKDGLKDLLKARQYLERLIKEHGGKPATEF